MNIHNIARTTPYNRSEIVRRVMGLHGMLGATPADVVEQVIALRRQRITGKQIAAILKLSSATVRRVLCRARRSHARTHLNNTLDRFIRFSDRSIWSQYDAVSSIQVKVPSWPA